MDVIAQKVHTKCAKLVDENNSLTVLLSKCSIESRFFFLWRKVYILFIKKAKKSTCHRTTFYSIFNMSSCRKLEIQNDLPKITQIKWICFFLTDSGQKSLTMLI